MKKLTALIFTSLLACSLTACGGEKSNGNKSNLNNENTQRAENVTIDDLDLDAILNGNGDETIIWSNQSPEIKQAVIDEAKKEGFEVTFNNDGNMELLDPSIESTFLQKPDGTWTVTDKDGTQISLGDNWPDNELTKLIPKPKFEVENLINNTSVVYVTFKSGVALNEVKDYVKKVKEAGFDVGPQEFDMNNTYTFFASNKDNVSFTLSYKDSQFMISINKN